MPMDLYANITDRIIAEMETGIIPWRKPWSCSGTCAISHVTGKPYSLLNQILLGGKSGEYLTFRQCTEEGGHVRKGEKARYIVFWKWLEKKEPTILPDGREIHEQIPLLRHYSVFHIDQCEGISPRYDAHAESVLSPDEGAEKIVQDYVSRCGVKLIITRSADACYRPSDDTVTVPEMSQYTDVSEYYSTLYHELTHSTGHPSRLNRIHETAAFASCDYSREELIAEMGSAFLMNTVGLETASSFRNSAAYLRGWLKALQDDKRLIVTAAGQAEKAVSLILGRGDAP